MTAQYYSIIFSTSWTSTSIGMGRAGVSTAVCSRFDPSSHTAASSNCAWDFPEPDSYTSDGSPVLKLRYVALRDIRKGEVLTFSYNGDGLNMLA